MAEGPTKDDYISVASVVALGPIMLLASLLVSKCCGRKRAKDTERQEPSETSSEGHAITPPRKKKARVLYFDAWRVLCVMCVVVTHADENYARSNTGNALQWVLQILLVISGTCFGFSKTSFAHVFAYVARLMFIISIGCAANWAGAAAGGIEWWTNWALHIGFQNFFLLLMCGAAVAITPLKAVLGEEEASWRAKLCCGVCYGLLTAVSAFAWHTQPTEVTTNATCFMSMLLLASVWVAATSSARQWRCLLGWGMLLWIFGMQVIQHGSKPAFWTHLAGLYSLALVVQRVPLRWAKEVGMFLLRGWPFIFVAGALVGSFPGQRGRHEKEGLDDPIDRARFWGLELLFVVAFVTIPTVGVENSVRMPQALVPHLSFLNWWALFIFCFHKAVYYVVEPIPGGLAISLGSGLVGMLIRRLLQEYRRVAGKTVDLPRHLALDDDSKPEGSNADTGDA